MVISPVATQPASEKASAVSRRAVQRATTTPSDVPCTLEPECPMSREIGPVSSASSC